MSATKWEQALDVRLELDWSEPTGISPTQVTLVACSERGREWMLHNLPNGNVVVATREVLPLVDLMRHHGLEVRA